MVVGSILHVLLRLGPFFKKPSWKGKLMAEDGNRPQFSKYSTWINSKLWALSEVILTLDKRNF